MNSRNIVLPVSGSMYIYASMGKRGQMFDRWACKYVFSFLGGRSSHRGGSPAEGSAKEGRQVKMKRKHSLLSIVVFRRQY